MDTLARRVTNASANSAMPITIDDIVDESDDDDDDSDFELHEETMLEAYNTPLDEDTCPIDEYDVFKEVMTSECD